MSFLRRLKATFVWLSTIPPFMRLSAMTAPRDMGKRLQLCRRLLNRVERSDNPRLWAVLQHELGKSLFEYPQGDRQENIEDAIVAFRKALEIFSPRNSLQEWVEAVRDLGSSYVNRLAGDRAENLEQAIEILKTALQHLPPEKETFLRSSILLNLSIAFSQRVLGSRRENLEQALAVIESALPAIPPKPPLHWAQYHDNRATTLRELSHVPNLSEEEKNNYRRQAVEAYESAAKLLSAETYGELWARIQNNLGNVYEDALRDGDLSARELALRCYDLALSVRTRARSPIEWANTLYNKANALTRPPYERERLDQAVELYRLALEIYRPELFSVRSRNVAINLGQALEVLDDWEAAYRAYLDAHRAASWLYRSAQSEGGKLVEISEASQLHRSLVESCLKLEPPRIGEAYGYLRKDHARILREGLGTLPLAKGDLPANLLHEEETLLQEVRAVTAQLRTEQTAEARRRRLGYVRGARDRLEGLWQRLERHAGGAGYVALRRGDDLEWTQIRQWLRNHQGCAVLVEFCSLEDKLLAFVTRPEVDQPRIVELALTRMDLRAAALQLFEEIHPGVMRPTAVENGEEHLRDLKVSKGAPLDATGTWQERVALLLPQLFPLLEGADLLYLIADRYLSYLPLHALEHEGQAWIERVPILYLPSTFFGVHMETLQRDPAPDAASIIVGDPTKDLPFAEVEARQVASLLNAKPLLGSEATKERVLEALPHCRYAHFAAHGIGAEDDILAASIQLADGRLMAREIMALTARLRLVVLSCCETGVREFAPGNDMAGLVWSFLSLGTSSLMVSLWSIDDRVSAQWMHAFYRRLTEEGEVNLARAFQEAVLEIRDRFPETYFWAPFVLFGVAPTDSVV